jgi:hypothetical protein
MGEKIVQSYNIFLNSDDAKGDGGNYDFQLGANAINCKSGEFIRLSLNNYSQYVTWPGVNAFNNLLILRNGGANSPITIGASNYASIADLADNVSNSIAQALSAAGLGWGAVTVNAASVRPVAGTGIGGTTDNRIVFDIDFATGWGGAPPDLTDVTAGNGLGVQALIDPENLVGATAQYNAATGGDSGLLLGLDRLVSTDTRSSWSITIPGASTTKLHFEAPYPALRNTQANLFVRVNPPLHVNGTMNFGAPIKADATGTITTTGAVDPTNILAEIRIDTEFVQYSPSTGREYFADYYQKTLNHINLRVTDKNNRDFNRFFAPSSNTTPTLSQSTTGNFHFTCTLRVDIVEGYAPQETTLPKMASQIVKNVPARFENILISQMNGKDTYGKPQGY